MTFRTRFAPSPTGPLHLGHAYSAITAHDMAAAHEGTFVLRIEDIDQSRARPEWEALILDDLDWLGLRWETPIMRQSDRQMNYDAALDALWARGLLYPCTCNRRDIAAAISAPQEGSPLLGPDGLVYPGTCRGKSRSGPRPFDVALRLDMDMATDGIECIRFEETGTLSDAITVATEDMIHAVGDIVIARKDMGTSYHLSVVLDDAAQNISHVVRGEDLFDATQIHVVLQQLLGLRTPIYHHHALVRDDAGKRLAKRDNARAISTYRAEGLSPNDVRRLCQP